MIRPLAALLALALTVVAGCSLAAPSPSTTRGTTGAPASTPGADGIALAAVSVPRLIITSDDAAGRATRSTRSRSTCTRSSSPPTREANLVFSPASIAVALAMARAGARGTTAAEMDAVMHGLGCRRQRRLGRGPRRVAQRETRDLQDAPSDDQEVILRSVNSPFAQQGYPLEDAYLAALAERFGAGLRLVDYIGDTEGARGASTAGSGGQTEERIPELLAAGT